MRLLPLLALSFAISGPVFAKPFAVGRYQSPGLGPVNSWWLETPDGGLAVFDTQRDAASAAAAIAAIKRENKPVRAISITHPHPDHVSGLRLFKQAFPGAPVIAQSATAAELRDDTQKLLTGEGAPLPPQPDRLIGDERVVIGGLRVVAVSVGAGESVASTLYWLPQIQTLVTGDLATPDLVPFLAEGRTQKWVRDLGQVSNRYAPTTRALPGHGAPGELATLASAQTRYLMRYQARIAAAIRSDSPGGGQLLPGEIDRVTADQAREFGTRGQVAGLPPAKLALMNAQAVAKELAASLR